MKKRRLRKMRRSCGRPVAQQFGQSTMTMRMKMEKAVMTGRTKTTKGTAMKRLKGGWKKVEEMDLKCRISLKTAVVLILLVMAWNDYPQDIHITDPYMVEMVNLNYCRLIPKLPAVEIFAHYNIHHENWASNVCTRYKLLALNVGL
ncbi:hypothetical protein HS088_TW13G01680 [Tripterygium wilfordii]|uniref:Uncharacterized protein n=1 Tax=Tripterygium wilfordii TaxID=458696 RepID=A0A7J7CXV9_TRIWF|nr:hypothetical protein HS088_TW13G01680 [Tripterygium wilfordii]